MRLVLPIIFLAVGFGLFFVYINPTYGEISDLQTQVDSYDRALSNSKELQKVRDVLGDKYKALTASQLERLSKAMPDSVNNIRLILDVQNIAAKYGMIVKDVKYDVLKESAPVGAPVTAAQAATQKKDYGIFDLELSLAGTYPNFVDFLKDLEKSLRLVDVASISFSTSERSQAEQQAGAFKYDIRLRTYWLKGI